MRVELLENRMSKYIQGDVPMELTSRQAFMLAALAADPGASFEPVQVQKFFFLLDENVTVAPDEKHFEFQPYDYGPFDKDVYAELEDMESLGLVRVSPPVGHFSSRNYSLTFEGQEKGREEFAELDAAEQKYIKEISNWVRSLSFARLVGSIYKAYPEMRKNSIFQD